MKKGAIAVLMPAVFDTLDTEFLTGVQLACQSIGFDTFVFTSAFAESSDSYTSGGNNIYRLPFMADVDGIIMPSNRFHNNYLKDMIINQMENATVPCVLVEQEHNSIKGVFSDQSQNIYDITEHLIKHHKYKDILCLTGPEDNSEAQKRAEGFVRAMNDNNLDSSRVIYGDFWRDAPAALAKQLADKKISMPRAIVCTNDIMAVNLCQQLPLYNIKVPDDIAVTGFDGSVYSLMTKPAVTTMCNGDLSLGFLSVKTLADMMGIKNDIEYRKTQLRICGSCGCKNESAEREALIEQTDKLLRRRLDRKPLILSNYIARMSDCKTIPEFSDVLDSLRYVLYDCKAVNVCLCDDWKTQFPEYRKSGYSNQMNLIYSQNQPGQLCFDIKSLLPCLNFAHESQLWVFSSLHYSDKIMGYIATCYEKAEQFTVDEHYIGWCDAVANGLDMVIKKSNAEFIRQKLEEKNMTDIYTGLLSKNGFISKIKDDENILVILFPSHCKDMQYFLPVVSEQLRSCVGADRSVFLGETAFAVFADSGYEEIIIKNISNTFKDIGVYIGEDEIACVCISVNANNAQSRLDEALSGLSEKNTPKSDKAYLNIFSSLRNEMRYSPDAKWCISYAATQLGISTSHFQRLYTKYFNVSFTEELISFRIDRAKYLLENTAMSVTQISEECGYVNGAHFMRQFKLREGISAGEYRKQNLK